MRVAELPWASALLAGAAVLVWIGLPTPARPVLGPPAVPPSWLSDSRWASLATAVAALVLAGPVAAVLSLIGVQAVVRRRTGRAVAARRQEERSGAAEALAVLSSELRAGRTTSSALWAASAVAVGALGDGLSAAAAAGDLGADPAEALIRATAHSAVPEVLRGLAACWQVCASTGSSLAAAVDRLSASIRAEQAQRLAVASELAGPRATAAMLGLLPLAGIGLAAGLGARPLHVLLHTPVGIACLGLGLGLEWLGMRWTGRLVAAAGGDA